MIRALWRMAIKLIIALNTFKGVEKEVCKINTKIDNIKVLQGLQKEIVQTIDNLSNEV